MTLRRTIVLAGAVCCLSLISSRSIAAEVAPPSGPPPIAARVILQDGTLYRMQPKYFPETRTRTIRENGTERTEAYTVMVPQYQIVSTPKVGYVVFTVSGKRLTDEQAAAELSQEKDVLLSIGRTRIDSRYTSLYSPTALIIYIRPEAAVPGYGAPQEPSGSASSPPAFSSARPPNGLPPSVGFLRVVGGKVLLTEFRWEMLYEHKRVHEQIEDSSGKTRTVAKVVSQSHWVPDPVETRLEAAAVKSLDVSGKQTHGLFDQARDEPLTVFLQDAANEFDPKHFSLCQPSAVVVQGPFPPARLTPEYSAPAAPTECFAHVRNKELFVGKTVPELKMSKVPVTVKKDGKEVTQYVEKATIVSKFIWLPAEFDKVKAMDVAGKKLDTAELTRRLATAAPAMIAASEEPLDLLYRAALKPQTIVFTQTGLHSGPRPVAPSTPGVPQAVKPAMDGTGRVFVAAQVPAAADGETPVELKAPAEGLPPRLVKIQSIGNKLVLRQPMTTIGYADVPPAAPGATPEQPVPKAFASWDSKVIDSGDVRIFEVNGRPVDPAAFAENGRRPTIALLSDQGKKVDPAWLSIYNPDVLIVYVRPETLHSGYGSVMAPPTGPAPASPTAPAPAPAPVPLPTPAVVKPDSLP